MRRSESSKIFFIVANAANGPGVDTSWVDKPGTMGWYSLPSFRYIFFQNWKMKMTSLGDEQLKEQIAHVAGFTKKRESPKNA